MDPIRVAVSFFLRLNVKSIVIPASSTMIFFLTSSMRTPNIGYAKLQIIVY